HILHVMGVSVWMQDEIGEPSQGVRTQFIVSHLTDAFLRPDCRLGLVHYLGHELLTDI
ncbi:hypothetical protein BgiBS90_011015, partial [Biomphalaria glabrata]